MKHKKGLLLLLILPVLCLGVACGPAEDPDGGKPSGGDDGGNTEEERIMTDHSVFKEGVPFDDALWTAPRSVYNETQDRTEDGNVKALWLRSDYGGKESYAFCYLGLPEDYSETGSFPAVLLIHGGGGTAYWQWAKTWKDRGYVALAVDMEGHQPLASGTMDSAPADLYRASPYSAPHNQNYGDAALPIEETWMHYAARTAIIGNSFLHNFAGVNRYKIGVCGVSWGGIITSIISGYDDRFAFSIPIYCSLNQIGTDSSIGGYYAAHPEAAVWDTDAGLAEVKTPVRFVVSNVDPNARLDSVSLTKEHCKNASLTVLKDWLHSQSIAAAAAEPYAFADSVVKSSPLARITVQPDASGRTMEIGLPEGGSVRNAFLVYTSDPLTRDASWSKRRLPAGSSVAFEVPESATVFYLSVEDNLNRTLSSDLIRVEK